MGNKQNDDPHPKHRVGHICCYLKIPQICKKYLNKKILEKTKLKKKLKI